PDPVTPAIAHGKAGTGGVLLSDSDTVAFTHAVATADLTALTTARARTSSALTLPTRDPDRDEIPAPDLALDLAVVHARRPDAEARVLAVYGGRAYEPQIDGLKNGVDIVVGTHGRLLDLEKQKYLNLGGVAAVVLDEADKMLDLGFLPDIERILKRIPDERQA